MQIKTDYNTFIIRAFALLFRSMGPSGFLYDYFHDNNFKFVELGTYLIPCVCYEYIFSLHHEARF